MQEFTKNSNIFSLLSQAVSEGVVVINQKHHIIATNEAANEMFGFAESELVGQHLDILVPQKYLHMHDKHVDAFMQYSDKRQMGHGRDLHGKRKDGSLFPVEAGLNPFTIDGEIYVMALVIDITVRKAQQQEILDLNSQLEKKISSRTKQLEDTVLKLQEEAILRQEAEERMKTSLQKERDLGELKTKFLSLVSHEFKTPLTGMLSSAILAERYTLTEQQDKRDKHLKIIKNKIKYLDNILNDFLSIERLETGKVNYKMSVFPLSKVINEVVYDANMLLKEGQNIKYPDHVDEYLIMFDEKILELAISNLINNAIKYSPEHTQIKIKTEAHKDRLQISVKDQGIGIPLEEQKFIFQRYFRAENALTNQGTGIGLNILKSHLENLNGSISFTSSPQGSCFTIEIPLETT